MPLHQTVAAPDEGQINLWCAIPDEISGESLNKAGARLLSEDERARWQTFRSENHRREYLTTRVLVRTALSHYYPLAPEAWSFQTNINGKPVIAKECGLQFNLSNSHHLVACLIAKGTAVGIDVEPYEHAEEIAHLSTDVFSQQEQMQLEALPAPARLDRALSLWTLKEAYVKAEGTGLSLPLNKVSFLFGGIDGISIRLDPDLRDAGGKPWRFCLLDYAGHRMALMAERLSLPELHVWVVKSLLAPPSRVQVGEVRWFPASDH